MEHSFQEIKKQYIQQRKAERLKLTNYLKKHSIFANAGLKVVTGGRSGSGIKYYTSGGIIFPFDLSNWQWVECKNEEDSFNAIISLNMLDEDLSSGNTHALYDRVGLFLTYKHKDISYRTSIVTDIDLPFDDTSLEAIARLIVEQFEIYSWVNR